MRQAQSTFHFHVVLSATVLLLAASYAAHSQKNAAQPATQEQTARQAVELLRARCVSCHNDKVKSGGVVLDTRAGALATNAFMPDKPDTSRLAQVVQSGRMPPTGKLPAADIALLTAWIKAGASWPASANALHPASSAPAPLWSLQPVRHAAVPRTPFDARAVNPIDRFIFARLAAKGLKPSPAADRATLLRRVSIDLTGLPPTPAELDAFLKDTSSRAYEMVVDRLLASPAYGERWGRHWLDVVRYGESTGYEQNHLRPNAWPYRDYVIRAFNEDKPYTQFIAEQLAGDVLAPHDPNVNAATGFLVAGVHDNVGIQTEEGTRQQRSNDLDDMTATTGAAFLGLSVGCAKCHDHKFDPIPQKDYYRLTACFAGVRHGERALPRPTTPAPEQIASLNRRVQSLANDINALDDAARQMVLRQRGGPADARPAVNARRNVDDFAPTLARFVRFTVLATRDNAEPCLDELQVFGADLSRNLALAQDGAKAAASSLLPGHAIHQIAHLNDGQFGNDWSWISSTPGSGWAQIELPRPALIQRVVWSRDGAAIPRLDDRVPTRYRIEVSQDGKTWQTVGSEARRQGSSDYIHPDKLRAALTPVQQARRDALAGERAGVERELASLQSQRMAYVGQFANPDPIYLLNRGDVMQRIEPVTPGALSCVTGLNADLNLPPDASEPQRRLALATWIGDTRNPLTARVLVNRVWQYHFGRGLVNTPSDFGRNGERPTHPELLDWLAAKFMEKDEGGRMKDEKNNVLSSSFACGWKLKRLHKMIVMSSTYRQSSEVNAKAQAVDAGDQLLWRMPLRRMEAEAIRDAILQASGKLDRRMGGPSFALFKYRVVNVAIYEPLESYGSETWRRSVYQQPARAIHDEVLSAFDCPESSQRAPRRDATTTALQALNPAQRQVPGTAGRFSRRTSTGRSRNQRDRAGATRLPPDLWPFTRRFRTAGRAFACVRAGLAVPVPRLAQRQRSFCTTSPQLSLETTVTHTLESYALTYLTANLYKPCIVPASRLYPRRLEYTI